MANTTGITQSGFAWRLIQKLLSPISRKGLIYASKSRPGDSDSLGIYLERNARERPDALAIGFKDRYWTWDEFNRRANQVAHALKSRGVGPGDAVAVFLGNRPELLMTTMGIVKLGAVASMINTAQSGEVLSHSLGLVSPKLIIAGHETLGNLDTVSELMASDYRGKVFLWDAVEASAEETGYIHFPTELVGQPDANLPETASVTLGMAAYHIFTSGTTGMPKASIASHLKTVRAGHYMGGFVLQMRPEDTLYCPLPFYHSNALTLSFASVLVGGSTIAIGERFSASKFWDECRHFNATTFCYIGETLRYLLNQPPASTDRSHKVTKIIGNGLRPELWEDFKTRFGIERIHEFYGSSEGNGAFVNAFNFNATCGWAPGVEKSWTIVAYDVENDRPHRTADNRLQQLGVGETGLLLTKITLQNPYDGYSDQEASNALCLTDEFEPHDAWVNTGDLLTRLPAGHVQFVDRTGDTFRWNGENVATTEVEAAVTRWRPVDDAVVYGVTVPGYDGRCGMLALTASNYSQADLDELAHHLREELPSYAVPRFLRLMGQADLTGTFKHQKSKLKSDGIKVETFRDPVFVLTPAAQSWLPLTAERINSIHNGEMRL